MKWCELGPGSVDDGVLTARCKGDAVDEDGTAQDYGSAPMMCALGVSASPYQATGDGCAEALVDEDVAGQRGVIVAARDSRSAKTVGNLKPGDTALHSTGPQQASQVQCKEEKRQVVAITKNASGKAIMLLLDGDGDGNVQLTIGGAMFEISGNGDRISLVNKSGSGLLIQDKTVHVIGPLTVDSGGSIGDQNAAGPAARADFLVTYLTALETVLATVAGATVPPTAGAVAAFVAATATAKASITGKFSKVS